MEGPASGVCGMMHLLLDHGETSGHLHQTLTNVYHNFTSIHKASITVLEHVVSKFQIPLDLSYEIGIFITFCRCSLMMWIVNEEDGTINQRLAILLADIERHLVYLIRDCTNQLSSEDFRIHRLHYLASIKFMVPRTANAYLVAFAQGYCYSPSNYRPLLIGYELVLEFVDQVLEDLEIGCGWDELKEALKRDLIFLRKYLELLIKEDRVSGDEELNELLISVRILASKIACCSFLRRYKLFMFYQVSTGVENRIESDVRFDVLRALILPLESPSRILPPMTDELLVSYVKFFQQSLLELLKHEESIDPQAPIEKDQLKILHDRLRFPLHLLTNYAPKHWTEQKKLTDIRVGFQDLARSVGSFIYSCFNGQTKGSANLMLSDLIEKVDLIEENITEIIYCVVLDRMERESGRTEQLSFSILLFENLNELVDRRSGLFLTWKDQFDTIQKNLVLLGSFLLNVRHNSTLDDGSENVEDLNDIEMDTQIKILLEKLRVVEKLCRSDQICGDELNELLISAQVVAFRMSCCSLLRRYGVLKWHQVYSKTEKWVDSHMHVKILGVLILSFDGSGTTPLTDELLIGYVGCVQDNLKMLTNDKVIDPLKEQLETVHELLSSLVHLLTSYRPKHNTHQEKLSELKLRFQDSVRSLGTVVCSCFDNPTKGNIGTELSTWLSELIEKMNLIKVKTMEILPLIILNRIGRESPRTNQLGFLNFLLGNWEQLMEYESDLRSWKDQFHMIHENLILFRSFIQNVFTSNSTGDDEFQNLNTLIMDAGYVAEYLLDSFSNGASPLWCKSVWICEFMKHIELIRAAVMEVNYKYANDMEASNDEKDPSGVQTTNGESKNLNRVSSRPLIPTTDEVVGFEVELKLIREQLASNLKELDVVSIIGMAGLGKTTLARKIYEDPFVANHFQLRAWCVVSLEYNERELFLTILSSLIELSNPIQKMSEVDLSVLLHKQLMGRRYLIVLDDVWGIDVFMNLKRFFPNDGNGSRIILTTRNKVIGLEAKCHSDPTELGLLSEDESWNLLELKVYRNEKCPLEFCQVGKEIAGKCRGLPLAIVLVAGLLAKSVRKRDFWEQVAGKLSSYLARDSQTVWMPALELSYEYLPEDLKPFFLYLGAFPEDKEIPADKLIWLWIAEGLVHTTELRSSEVQAETCLMELIDRSLVMIAKRRSDGRVKACHVHDLLRDMCLTKAREANFMHQIYAYNELTDPIIYQRRLSVFMERNTGNISTSLVTYDYVRTLSITPPLQTFLLFNTNRTLPLSEDAIKSVCSSVKLLKVLHSESTIIDYDAYNNITTLVHLRYMSIRASFNSIPSSISSLSNLQTLIIKGIRGQIIVPDTIWEMLKLRHLHVNDRAIFSDAIENSSKLENLVTLSTPAIDVGEEEKLIRKVPNLEKLRCILSEGSNSSRESYHFPDFESLNKLESLKVLYYGSVNCFGKLKLPPALKKLSLSKFRLKWSDISMFQKLPNLEVLNLHWGAVHDEFWDTGDDEFVKLKSLKLEKLNIKRWSASAENFPRLQKLVVERCKQLEEIPSSLGDFYSLRKVEVLWCSHSAAKSAKEIQEEQQDAGNELLKVHIRPPLVDSPSYYWVKVRTNLHK